MTEVCQENYILLAESNAYMTHTHTELRYPRPCALHSDCIQTVVVYQPLGIRQPLAPYLELLDERRNLFKHSFDVFRIAPCLHYPYGPCAM